MLSKHRLSVASSGAFRWLSNGVSVSDDLAV